MANREFNNDAGEGTLSSSGSKQHGLTGFSSNKGWAGLQESGLWSHNPVHPGPKEGLKDPAQGEPARQQLPFDTAPTHPLDLRRSE